MPTPSDRRFDEREVALILQETAALQERAERAGDARAGAAALPARRGLSLAQLEQIAGEAGLEPALVRRAVTAVDARRAAPRGHPFLGAPPVVDVARTIEGELSAEAHEALLEAVRRATGELGEMTAHGRQFGWQGTVDGAKAQVAVSPASGRTEVRVRFALDEVALGIFMTAGVMGGGFGGIMAGLAAMTAFGVVGLPVGGAVLGAGYLTSRTIFKRTEAKLRARAEAIADGVAEAAKGEIDRSTD